MARTGIFKVFHIYVRAFRQARSFWPALALILATGLAWIPISLLFPLPLKLVIDNVLGGKPLDGMAAAILPSFAVDHERLLLTTIALSLVIGMLGLGYKFAEWLLRETVADRMVHRFRGDLLLHGLRLGALHHAANGSFDLSYRITQDSAALQWTAIYGVIPVVVSLANIVCTVLVTAAISPKLAAIAIATAMPTIGLVHLYQQRLKAKWRHAKEEDSAAQALVHETL
ncbi:MAG: ABC transporter ATP-binding protein, partial [Alphaproteobacteria bacterium]|nr:ABC transporter ATP-binding protein [Alphaproteobacteria bacterium]